MQIFEQEIKDGLELRLRAESKVVLSAAIRLADAPVIELSDDFISKAFANSSYQPNAKELFYMENIVTSSAWNGNDDVTLKSELKRAYQSCIHKPVNVEHADRNIIGHTISARLVKEDYSDADMETLDDADEIGMIHLLAGDVIYKVWHDPSFENSVAKIIDEIKNNDWSVSMECTMEGFDYAMRNDSESFIVARNKETSHITKNLRLFGGSGEYQGYKVGRVMRGISFCGKGIVKQPANPYSIIFNKFSAKAKNFVYVNYDKVISTHGETFMSDELKDELKAVETENRKLSKEIAVAEVRLATSDEKLKTLTEKVEELVASNKKLTDKLTETDVVVANLTTKNTELEGKVSTLTSENDKLSKEVTTSSEKVRLQNRKNTLTASLLDKKIDKAAEIAAEFVDKHASKDDETYSDLVTLFVEAKVASKPAKSAAKKTVADAIEDGDVSEVEDETETVDSELDEFDFDTAEASMAFASSIGLTPKKKETK